MKKYILTLLILLTAWHQSYSQNFAIEVKLRPEMASRSGVMVETTEISALSLRHGVKLIPHPLAERHPEFSLYYTLVGHSCKESTINDFLATGKFENYVRDLSILIYPLSCANPVTVNDPDFQNTHGWPLRLINAPCAWTITRGNPNVLIGVVDTEFRTTHEDLQNRFASISGQPSGGHHHGTSVASVAAAGTNNGRGIAGIGFNSRLAAYRIFHYANGSSYAHHARAAIMNLYLMGVPIINVSWTRSGLSRSEAQAITRSGTTLVLSGGNTIEAENHSYIADIPGVIIVSSVSQGNMIGPTNHSRSQYISIVAPGANIRVADGGSDTHYRQASGTSLSAPFVAGTIALMLSVNPILMPAQIEEILKATADPIADGHLLPGRGRLNAYAAVRAVAPRISGPAEICAIGTFYITNTNFPVTEWKLTQNPNSTFTITSPTINVNSVTVRACPNGQTGTLTAIVNGVPVNRSISACLVRQGSFFISGPNEVCNPSQATFELRNHPIGATINWTHSSNISRISTGTFSAPIEGFGETENGILVDLEPNLDHAIIDTMIEIPIRPRPPFENLTPATNSRVTVRANPSLSAGYCGRGSITATLQMPGCPSIHLHQKMVYVGTRPNYLNLLSLRHNDNIAGAPCEFEDVLTFTGIIIAPGNPWGITRAEWIHHSGTVWFTHDLPRPSLQFNSIIGANQTMRILGFPGGRAHVYARMGNHCCWSYPRRIEYFWGTYCPSAWGFRPFDFTLSPNPVSDILTIDLTQADTSTPLSDRGRASEETIFDIRLLNSHGMVVRQQRTQARSIQFDVSNLPEGTYYLHIEHNGEVEMHQIIVQRN